LDALGQPDSEIFYHHQQWVIMPLGDSYSSEKRVTFLEEVLDKFTQSNVK